MYATEEYIEAVLALYSFEGTVFGYTGVLSKTNYENVAIRLNLSLLGKHEQIRMLASYGLAETLSSINYPDNALSLAKDTLQLLRDNKKLSKQFDGMIAKAIQSLRYHMDYSFTQFIE